MAVIEGKLKVDKVQKWAEATENRIGKRIGFVFNDSVIMAPTVNCRIESGGFTINSPDKVLIIEIYKSGRLDIWGDGLYIKSAKWTFWVITEQ